MPNGQMGDGRLLFLRFAASGLKCGLGYVLSDGPGPPGPPADLVPNRLTACVGELQYALVGS
jgi:hypothetical protein